MHAVVIGEDGGGGYRGRGLRRPGSMPRKAWWSEGSWGGMACCIGEGLKGVMQREHTRGLQQQQQQQQQQKPAKEMRLCALTPHESRRQTDV